MQRDKKICVIGGGQWGANHISTLDELNMLGGIVDIDLEILQKYKLLYPHLLTFHTISNAIKTNKFSGYIVSTPADTHYKIAMEIINSGCHVLVEKPITLKKEDALRLKIAAEMKKVNLMVGHVLLFHPAIKKMKEIIELGTIGKLQYLYSNRLNLGTIRTKENVFWSLAPHDISLFQHFTKLKPLKITTSGGAFLQKDIHDTTLTILEYKNNIKGHIFVSWLHPFKEHRLVIIGSKAMISFEESADNKPLKLYFKKYDCSLGFPKKEDGPVENISYSKEMPLMAELKYFIHHLDGSPMKIANGENAIDVLDVLVKASESLVEGVSIE